MHKIFRYPRFSETPKGSPRISFGTVRQKISDGKIWYPTTLLSIIFFHARNFLKHKSVPLRSFSALWDKKVLKEKRDTPPIMHKIFRYPKFLETQKSSHRNSSALWDKKKSTNRDAPLLCIKIFDTRIFSKHKGSPTNFFGTETKNFERSLLHII